MILIGSNFLTSVLVKVLESFSITFAKLVRELFDFNIINVSDFSFLFSASKINFRWYLRFWYSNAIASRNANLQQVKKNNFFLKYGITELVVRSFHNIIPYPLCLRLAKLWCCSHPKSCYERMVVGQTKHFQIPSH